MNTKLATSQIRLNEWAAIIKDCKSSGQKVDIYCEQHGCIRPLSAASRAAFPGQSGPY